MMLPLTMILARARRGVIGLRGGLPWPRIAEDMRRFKAATMGHTLIVGRKTLDTLPPLPGRYLCVVSRQPRLPPRRGEPVFVHTVPHAIEAARWTDDEPVVIGGAQVYAAALPYVTRALVTEIERDVEGDTFFDVDFAAEGLREVSREVMGHVDFVEWRRP